ncbi:DUF2922 domain-containing protein [Jeotgalibacillus sp. R-1-5s-1]|uniref:DUF2922 domain-containing protein n=1 Tax=Jeotgalibacillus sp. R-1-5s-1 TaxID=2555897 RepID=UPI00106BD735|nr:DUF2922 domain-containing protein [Jeotgalibacillus sp. R-1-5s-1]TFD99671.1 DUF2922 domain-containing protein [Jeotgalibacillus sp. R-1-5s-1]
MDKTLELIFITSEGSTTSLSVDGPTEPIDPAAVQTAMQTIIDQNAFVSTSGSLVGIKSARVLTRGVEPVDFAL